MLIHCRNNWLLKVLPLFSVAHFITPPAGLTYFNTTPLGRAVTGTMLVAAMKEMA